MLQTASGHIVAASCVSCPWRPGWVDAAAVLLIVIVSFDVRLPSRLVLLPGSCCLKELLLRVCVYVCVLMVVSYFFSVYL